jgi:hypothetical protein
MEGYTMANKYFREKILTGDNRAINIAGSFSLNSSAAVTSTNKNYLVESIAKTATGTYVITLADKYVALRSCTLTYEGASVNTLLTLSATDITSARTITIKTITNSSGTHAVADTGTACTIHFNIMLKDHTSI